MKIEIRQHDKWTTIHATKIRVQVMPFGTLIDVGKTYYPIYPGQVFYITDDGETSLVPADAQKGPKLKYKQGKLGI